MRTFGIERERFIMSRGQIVPAIGILLPRVHETAKNNNLPEKLFSYELFAGQIEDRTPPCRSLEEIKSALVLNDKIMSATAKQLGLAFDYSEIIDPDKITALEVNPFDSRHKNIWSSISLKKRIAASIVAGERIKRTEQKLQ